LDFNRIENGCILYFYFYGEKRGKNPKIQLPTFFPGRLMMARSHKSTEGSVESKKKERRKGKVDLLYYSSPL